MGFESLKQTENKIEKKFWLTRKERKQKETSHDLWITSENNSVKSEHRQGEEKDRKLKEKVKSW